MIRAAFRNEMRKMWKRPATWVTLGLFCLITVADLFDSFRDARTDPEQTFSLPGAWPQILGEEVMIGFIFAAVLAILLIAAEFSWRTARQNVIDGLSKMQWYAAKALVLPLLTLLFLLIRVLGGAGFALAGTEAGHGAPLFGLAQLAAIGGMTLTGLGYTALALFIATVFRSSGPAMAVWFAWYAFGERLLVGGLGRLFEGLRPVLQWAPISTFNRLRDYLLYDPDAFRRASELASAEGRTLPDPADPTTAVLGALAWITALVVVGGWWVQRRDL